MRTGCDADGPGPALTAWSRAVSDIVTGACATHLWARLGWQDIRGRYRRSVLGPLWITLSMGLLVTLLGVHYGRMFGVRVGEYLPHLTLGFVLWSFLSAVINEGCQTFLAARHMIHQVPLPLSLHVYRVVWRNLTVLGHNASVFVVVAAVFAVVPGWTALLALPGLALACVNAVWVALLLGACSARYRDVPPIVASVTRIVFFATPILWMPDALPERTAFVALNPFHHAIEVVRAPLLGTAPALASWLWVGGLAVVGWLATLTLFARLRPRVAYWL